MTKNEFKKLVVGLGCTARYSGKTGTFHIYPFTDYGKMFDARLQVFANYHFPPYEENIPQETVPQIHSRKSWFTKFLEWLSGVVTYIYWWRKS